MKKDIRWLIEQLEVIAEKVYGLEVVDMNLSQSSETDWVGLDSYGGTHKVELNIRLAKPEGAFMVAQKIYDND